MGLAPETAMPGALTPLGMLYMPLDGVVDVAAELARLAEELEKVNGFLDGVARKLQNESFISKAPENVVAQVRATRDELLGKQAKIQAQIAALG
jgi:valyl-tRNA synthetase